MGWARGRQLGKMTHPSAEMNMILAMIYKAGKFNELLTKSRPYLASKFSPILNTRPGQA